MSPVRDDTATTACGVCGTSFPPKGRQRFCSTPCRQSAWRRRRGAPTQPVVTRTDTVYECDGCGNRYLGAQRCDDCNAFARRIGPGGCCPHCDEPVAVGDLLNPDQFVAATPSPRTRKEAATSPT